MLLYFFSCLLQKKNKKNHSLIFCMPCIKHGLNTEGFNRALPSCLYQYLTPTSSAAVPFVSIYSLPSF